MITYTWTTKNLYTINVNNQTGYVVTVLYEVSATDGTHSAQFTNACKFTIKQNDPDYIPYSSLTNEIVINWVKEDLGGEVVNDIESSLAANINSQANPPQKPQNTPLPF